MPLFIGLLRGINVGGHNKLPMAELRSLCEELGWSDVQSYVQSGNLVFKADGAPAALEAELEGAIERRFGLSIPVIIRPAAAWPDYVAGNPFPADSEKEPRAVMLGLSKAPPNPDSAEKLQERATRGERLKRRLHLGTHSPGHRRGLQLGLLRSPGCGLRGRPARVHGGRGERARKSVRSVQLTSGPR